MPRLMGTPDFIQERHVLDVITKNIYHKRPSMLPFAFVEVINNHYCNKLLTSCHCPEYFILAYINFYHNHTSPSGQW